MNVVKNDRFTETWRFRKSHIFAESRSERPAFRKKLRQIRRHLPGKGRSFIIHRQQDTFDFEG